MSVWAATDDEREQFLRECAREKAQQEGAAEQVRDLLLRALAVAHENNWHWGAGEPTANVRHALEDLIGEYFLQDRPQPASRKQRIPPALRKAVLERDAYRCRVCLTWIDLAVDHIYPESLGGPTELDNLQALCKPCNSSKGARA